MCDCPQGIHNCLDNDTLIDIPAALRAAKWLYIFEAIFPAPTLFTKLGILYLYKRVFTTLNRVFGRALYTIAVLQVIWALSMFFTTVLQCYPVQILWTQGNEVLAGLHAQPCINLVAALTGLGISNIILNTAMLVLPIPMIWKLQTSRKHKIALSGVFALGCA